MLTRSGLALVVLAAGCADGAQTPIHLTPEIAASMPGAFVKELAVTSGGTFVVLALEDGSSQVLRRSAQGLWEPPHALPPPLPHPYGLVYRPPPAVNARGELLRVWSQTEGTGRQRLWGARYGVAGWSDPLPISAGASWTYDVVAVLDEEGVATAAWTELHDAVTTVWTARGTADGWGAPERLDRGERPAGIPRLVVAPDGVVSAVWGEGGAVRMSRRAPGGEWQIPGVIPGSDENLGPGGDLMIGLEESGDAVVGFTTVFDRTPTLELRATRCRLGGACELWVAMTRSGPWFPELLVAGHGALLRWEEPPVAPLDANNGNLVTEHAAIALPGRDWAAPRLFGTVRYPAGLFSDGAVAGDEAVVASYMAGGLAISRHSDSGWHGAQLLDFGAVYGVSVTSVRLAAGPDDEVYAAWSDGEQVYYSELP